MNIKRQDVMEKNTDQNEVFSFLSTPVPFADDTTKVNLINTHASHVFLGKSYVFKIKRPVKYDYMDFSTLEKRKANCDREFALNKAIAPKLYLAICAITREENGKLKVDGKGTPIEWAIKMRRFPEETILKNLALKNKLNNTTAINLGQNIATYHQSLKPLVLDDGVSRIGEVINELDKSLTRFINQNEEIQIHTLLKKLNTALDQNKISLKDRGEKGLIRRCHGDLHLNNIVLVNNEPTPFDALEFDERLATIDVIYDLSFLLMDLLHMGLKQQANIVLHRYCLKAWSLINNGGFKILPLCLSVRSTIRAMVLCQQATLQQPHDKSHIEEANNYLSLANKLLSKTNPALIAIGGLSGTGKSTLAAELAAAIPAPLGAVLLRSDLERKELLGVSEFDHLPKEQYTKEMSELVYNEVLKKAEKILSEGQPVIIDAVFLSEQERNNSKRIADNLNIPFCGLYLDTTLETLLKRVEGRTNDASDADQQVVKKQYSLKPNFDHFDKDSWVPIDASNSQNQTLMNARIELVKRKILETDEMKSYSNF